MLCELHASSEIASAKALVEQNGLSFEEGFDELFGIYENGLLVATGARAGNILKMLAVEPSHQGGPLLGDIVTALIMRGQRAGLASLFIYTKPEHVQTFAALHFNLLANQGKAALLEYGNGLQEWLDANASHRKTGINGAVVVNCNPFTRGHRYLIESASQRVDNLFIFVVREDRSAFPYDVRMRLVRAGTADLGNVTVLDTSRYIVSGATFPTYFLKKDDPVARIQMELDVTLFASRIAPYFGISRRFAGTEPCCPLTCAYNEAMRRLLPVYGIEFSEIERKQADAGVISASRVRALLAEGKSEVLKEFVPETTLEFLLSAEAEPIRKQLQQLN